MKLFGLLALIIGSIGNAATMGSDSYDCNDGPLKVMKCERDNVNESTFNLVAVVFGFHGFMDRVIVTSQLTKEECDKIVLR